MKVTTLLFAFLFVFTQVGNAQISNTARKAPSASATTSGNLNSDEEILRRAEQIRYKTLYQDYSNIASALADSNLPAADRLPTLERLTKAYFYQQPKSVNLPNNLLKADGTTMSDQEMSDFIQRLTKVSMAATRTKSSATADEIRDCFIQYFDMVHNGEASTLPVYGWVILLTPQKESVPKCFGVQNYLARSIEEVMMN